MEDIAPILLKKIQENFKESFNKNKKIKALLEKVKKRTATYREASDFASEIGEMLSAAFKKNISSEILPDGKLYYNIADRIIRETLEDNYNLVAEICAEVQTSLNIKAKIGIKAIKPEMNEDKVKGIIAIVSKKKYDDISYMLEEPVVNFMQSVVDDAVKVNADFQYQAGMSPKIIRTSSGKCCEWCDRLAGVYDYKDVSDTGNAVFRRHRYCRCLVEYDPGEGKRQNVHTKKWSRSDEADRIEVRKTIGIQPYYRTANMPPDEFARAKDLWKKNQELILPQKEKEHVYEELDNNLQADEKEQCIVRRPIGNYQYTAINMGHNQYKIILKEPILESIGNVNIDNILDEVLDFNWRELL